MADDVVIASASVQIVGDYSGLEKSFNESQNLAQAAGQKISAVFDSSAAGANALTTAVGTVANSVEDLATKSGLAGGELAIFKAALQGSLDAGVPLNAALQDIAASGGSLGTSVAAAAQALNQEAQAAAGGAAANDALGDSFKRVRNDAEALEAAWQKAIEEDKKLADAAKRDAAAFQQAWDAAIKENVARSNAEFQKFAEGVGNFISHPLQSAGKAVTDFMLALGPVGVGLLAVGATVAAVTNELFGLVKEFGAAAEATSNMADGLNISWQEMRNLEEMAQIAGVSVSGLQSASFRLAESLEGTSANGQKVAKALGDIGVAGATSGELLTNFLQKLSEIPDDTKRIAVAHEVLGKSSQQIIPLIKDYAALQEAVRGLGGELSTEMVAKIKASDDALDKLNIAWKNFKQTVAVFAAPGVESFVSFLQHLITGVNPTLDQQIAQIEAKMVSLGEKSALAGWLMADGMTKGKNATLEALKAQRELLVGQEQAIERSREYNAEIAKSNAAAKAASQPGLIQAIIDKQKELSAAVVASKAAYDTLNQAYKTGTPLANGYAVTSGDVARALSNMKAAEAAAATTKADHTEKVKALTHAMPPLAERTQEWVSQIKAATTEHQKLIGEASKLGEVIGRYVTAAEMASIKTAALNTSLRVAAEEFGGADIAIVSFMGHAEKAAPMMKAIADSINEAKQEALDTSPWAKLEAALESVGVHGAGYFHNLADTANKAYEDALASGTATYNELAQLALISAEAQIRAELAVGAITREEADKTIAQIQADLDKLDASQDKSTKTRGRAERTLGEDIQSINKRTFDSLERGLAQSIINMKGFSDLWKTLWHKLAEDVLDIMFKILLNPLEKQIGILLGQIPGLGVPLPGGKVPGVPSVPGAPAAGGAAGAVGSSLTGILTSIFTGITAASGIFGNFQQAQSETTLNAIEESTRYLKIGLVTQGDSLLNDSHVIRNTLTDMMKWNMNVFQTYLQNINIDLDKLTNMGGVHSQSVQSQISTFSTEKTARTETGPTIHVDMSGARIEAGVSDERVAATFNRGIRMSKLAGAFPAGRFPQ